MINLVIGADAAVICEGSDMHPSRDCSSRRARSRCEAGFPFILTRLTQLDCYGVPCMYPVEEICEPKLRYNNSLGRIGSRRCHLHRFRCCAGRHHTSGEEL